MTAVITGATGLLGKKLVERLSNPVVLSRDPAKAKRSLGAVQAVRWSPEGEPAPLQAFSDLDAVFNLAGEPVAEGRWTPEKKRRIRDSRILGTRNLVAGLAALAQKPKVLVSASAIGYYGDRGDEALDEQSSAGSGFLAEVCADWEREARAAEALGIRVVCVRIGIVLAQGGGALAAMLLPFKLGAGGRLGSGKQWMSWVHLDDAVDLLILASQSETVGPVLNAVAPNPVSNADFTRALGSALHRPTLLPVPKTALRVAFGEMSEVLLGSQRVLPLAAQRAGHRFRHPQLEGALKAVLR